ncbi:FAD-dependent oxidoreductase [Pseudonocardia halophobica]|uniref:FAD-dependent oxidoreductase n=1 Tax=Pseudonocardia halophobica TaxID=29401 RepID=UPI003D8A00B1
METVDVVVLGTGGAGLVAAVAAADAGAEVAVVEKGERVGGTTALSGGTTWIPANPHESTPDGRADALAYLDSLSHGLIEPALAEAFVDTGPEFVCWIEAVTPVRYHVVPGLPDYHPEHPGGKPGGGRSLDPDLFSFRELGEWADRVVMPERLPRLMLTETFMGGGRPGPPSRDERRERDLRGCGHALVGGLLKALLDRGIAPRTGLRATSLILGDGVEGVRFADGSEIRARRGVVLATGGFEWDPELVRAYLRGPMTSPASVPTNTGDGLRLAMAAGAQLGTMREAWWVPTVEIPGDEAFGRQRAQLVLRERSLPRSIMVNRTGRRFTNEAANYNALGGAFHQFDPTTFSYANLPCWLVFDAEYLRRYGFLSLPPGAEPPAWVTTAATLDELARRIGVPPLELAATVARFNAHVADGADTDFGRGTSAYDGWNGDQTHYPGPGATLGPLTEGPFHAVEIHSGALGTKGGPRTDVDGRVLDLAGAPIPGLYAAGNAMAGVTGMVYGGAGGTLGPGMVFGYRAGRHAGARVAALAEAGR